MSENSKMNRANVNSGIVTLAHCEEQKSRHLKKKLHIRWKWQRRNEDIVFSFSETPITTHPSISSQESVWQWNAQIIADCTECIHFHANKFMLFISTITNVQKVINQWWGTFLFDLKHFRLDTESQCKMAKQKTNRTYIVFTRHE